MRLALLVAIACSTPPPVAKPVVALDTQPLVFGETFTLDSKTLGEKRVVNVYLPPDYATTHASYPVLYMPDGGIKEDFPHIAGLVDVSIRNGVIRPFIVVGIENTERRRDLPTATDVPDEIKAAPHAGGSDKFRAFLRDELKPQIARRYRTTAESALVGESLAGLFVIETLLVEPDLFDSYVAVDPSLWWDHENLANSAAARFDAWHAKPKQVYIATGEASERHEGVQTLLDAIAAHKPAGLTVHFDSMPQLHHNNIFPIAAATGFRLLFAAP